MSPDVNTDMVIGILGATGTVLKRSWGKTMSLSALI